MRIWRIGAGAAAAALLLAAALLGACRQRVGEPARAASGPAARELQLALTLPGPPERLGEAIAAAAGARVGVVRLELDWSTVERSRGVRDWAAWDATIAAATARSLRVIIVLGGMPAWAARRSGGIESRRAPPGDPDDASAFARDASRRWRGAVHAWELWPGADDARRWGGSPADYAALVRASARGLRDGDADARIVLGALGDARALALLLRDHRLATEVDAVAVCAWGESRAHEPLEAVSRRIAEAADAIAEHGEGEPVWVTDAGYGAVEADNGGKGYPRYWSHEGGADAQAGALMRVAACALAQPHAALVAWRLPEDPEVARTALAAARALAPLCAGPVTPLDDVVRVERLAGGDAEVHAVRRADGVVTVLAWLRPYEPGERRWGGIGVQRDGRSEVIDVGFPFPCSDTAVLSDEQGRELGAAAVEPGGDLRRLRALRVAGPRVLVATIGPR